MGELSKLEREEKAEYDRNVVQEESQESNSGDNGRKRKSTVNDEDCEKYMYHKKQVCLLKLKQ